MGLTAVLVELMVMLPLEKGATRPASEGNVVTCIRGSAHESFCGIRKDLWKDD